MINPKAEALIRLRRTKQAPNPKQEILNLWYLLFIIWNLFRVSIFGFRILSTQRERV